MKPTKLNAQIYAEAADWLVEFRSGDIDSTGRTEFYHWLRTSPEHMRAYLELAVTWNEGSALDPHRLFDDARLLQEVRSETNIVPMANSTSTLSTRNELEPVPARWRWPVSAVVAASLLFVVIGGGYWYLQWQNVYSTRIGQQRAVTLDDGSTFELNSDSQVRVRFSRTGRDLDLLRGQVLFHVARERTRPFVVHAGATDIRAVGTQFDVYKQPTGTTTVTVIEGRVAVLYAPVAEVGDKVARYGLRSAHQRQNVYAAPVQDDGGAVLLSAGEQVTVSGAGAGAQRADHADVEATIAWTQHQLIFRGTPLQDVADEFNRYNSVRLVILDAQLESLRITGIFSSTNPSSLVRFLEARPDITVTQTDRKILVSYRR